jgi:hypothetical protein
MDRRSVVTLAAGAILAMAVAVGAVATDVIHPPSIAPTEIHVPAPAAPVHLATRPREGGLGSRTAQVAGPSRGAPED